MPDEPKTEVTEPKDEGVLSKSKNLKLQPSAEFVAEREAETGPQISLPSSPAASTQPQAASTPTHEPQPTEPAPNYTPAPDPLDLQAQAQAAPAETLTSNAPHAKPVVPAAFQSPEQVAATSKERSHHDQPAAQQFTLSSEAALEASEASASASLFSGMTLILGLLASLSYMVLFSVSKNEWVAAVVVVLMVVGAVLCSFKSYSSTGSMNPVTVMGLASAMFGLIFVASIYIAEWALRSMFGGFGL